MTGINGLQYPIEVTDRFSANLRAFRAQIQGARADYDRFRNSVNNRGNVGGRNNLTRGQRNLSRAIQVNNELLSRQARLWDEIRGTIASIETRQFVQVARDLNQVNRLLAQQERRLTNVERNFQRVSRQANNFGRIFRRAFSFAVVFRGLDLAFDQIRNAVVSGVRFGASIQTAERSAAGLALATGDVVTATGNILDAAQGFDVVFGEARQQVELLRLDALRTTATFEELLAAFQTAIAPGRAAGLDFDEIRRLSVLVSQAATALGLEQNQLAEEIRSIVQGTINPRNSRIGTSLGLRNETIRQAREQGELFEFLEARLRPFGVTIDRAFGDFNNVLARTRGAILELLGRGLEPLRNELTSTLLQVERAIRPDRNSSEINPELEGQVRLIGQALADAVVRVREFFNALEGASVQNGFENLAALVDTALQSIQAFTRGASAAFSVVAEAIRFIGQSFADFGINGEDVARIFTQIIGFIVPFRTFRFVLLGIFGREGLFASAATFLQPLISRLGAVGVLLRGLALANPLTATFVAVTGIATALLALEDTGSRGIERLNAQLEELQNRALEVATAFDQLDAGRAIGRLQTQLNAAVADLQELRPDLRVTFDEIALRNTVRRITAQIETIEFRTQLFRPPESQAQLDDLQQQLDLYRRILFAVTEINEIQRVAGATNAIVDPNVARVIDAFAQTGQGTLQDRLNPQITELTTNIEELGNRIRDTLEALVALENGEQSRFADSTVLAQATQRAVADTRQARDELASLEEQLLAAQAASVAARAAAVENIEGLTQSGIEELFNAFRESEGAVSRINDLLGEQRRLLAENATIEDEFGQIDGGALLRRPDQLFDNIERLGEIRQELSAIASEAGVATNALDQAFAGNNLQDRFVRDLFSAEAGVQGINLRLEQTRTAIRNAFEQRRIDAVVQSIGNLQNSLAESRVAADNNAATIEQEQLRLQALQAEDDTIRGIIEARSRLVELQRQGALEQANIANELNNLRLQAEVLREVIAEPPQDIGAGVIEGFRLQLDLLEEQIQLQETQAQQLERINELRRRAVEIEASRSSEIDRDVIDDLGAEIRGLAGVNRALEARTDLVRQFIEQQNRAAELNAQLADDEARIQAGIRELEDQRSIALAQRGAALRDNNEEEIRSAQLARNRADQGIVALREELELLRTRNALELVGLEIQADRLAEQQQGATEDLQRQLQLLQGINRARLEGNEGQVRAIELLQEIDSIESDRVATVGDLNARIRDLQADAANINRDLATGNLDEEAGLRALAVIDESVLGLIRERDLREQIFDAQTRAAGLQDDQTQDRIRRTLTELRTELEAQEALNRAIASGSREQVEVAQALVDVSQERSRALADIQEAEDELLDLLGEEARLTESLNDGSLTAAQEDAIRSQLDGLSEILDGLTEEIDLRERILELIERDARDRGRDAAAGTTLEGLIRRGQGIEARDEAERENPDLIRERITTELAGNIVNGAIDQFSASLASGIVGSIEEAVSGGLTGEAAQEAIAGFARSFGQLILEELIRFGVQQALLSAFSTTAGVPAGSNARGGLIPAQGFASGGIAGAFSRRGVSPLDTIPAWMRPGEYVIRPEAVRAAGLPLLDFINSLGTAASRVKTFPTRGFQSGGFVTPRDGVESRGGSRDSGMSIALLQTRDTIDRQRLANSRSRDAMLGFIQSRREQIRGILA